MTESIDNEPLQEVFFDERQNNQNEGSGDNVAEAEKVISQNNQFLSNEKSAKEKEIEAMESIINTFKEHKTSKDIPPAVKAGTVITAKIEEQKNSTGSSTSEKKPDAKAGSGGAWSNFFKKTGNFLWVSLLTMGASLGILSNILQSEIKKDDKKK